MIQRLIRILIVVVLVAAISLISQLVMDISPARAGSSSTAWRTEEEERTISVYREMNESVVFITTVTLTVDPFDFFPEIQPQQGSGSGVIVDAQKGIVLTNLHVIQDAQKIQIMLADGQPYGAKLLGYDDEYDLAALQLRNPPKNLKAADFGDSSKVEVGQRVLAIGNPFGLSRTLTQGIVSSLDRTVKSPRGALMKGLIQTDAAINPGNSGGPLLDSEGRLVGINTAILSQSGDSAGIGFAVPINQIRRVLPELIATGKVLRPAVGWVLVDTNQGPMVRRIMKGSPAELAGVEPIERIVENVYVRGYVRDFERADLIVAVNGKRVFSREDVDDIVSQADRQKEIEFVLRRGGARGPERKVSIRPVLQ